MKISSIPGLLLFTEFHTLQNCSPSFKKFNFLKENSSRFSIQSIEKYILTGNLKFRKCYLFFKEFQGGKIPSFLKQGVYWSCKSSKSQEWITLPAKFYIALNTRIWLRVVVWYSLTIELAVITNNSKFTLSSNSHYQRGPFSFKVSACATLWRSSEEVWTHL